MSPNQSLGDLLFLLRFLSLSLPNNVWRVIVFAPFLIIIKSPKQSFQICGKRGQSHIFGGSKRVGVTI